jgi:hypothetical protein
MTNVQTNLSGNSEFRRNWRNENHTSLRVANGFLSLFPTCIFSVWMKFSAWDLHIILSAVKIGTGKTVLFLWALMYIYLGLYPAPCDIYKCRTPLQILPGPLAVLLHLYRVEWTLSVLAVGVKVSSCLNLESKSPTLPSLTTLRRHIIENRNWTSDFLY